MTEAGVKGADEKFCTDCGSVIKLRAELCPKCGVRQSGAHSIGTVTAPNGKSKVAAGLFGILLGDFGAHKFYLGQPGLGVLYLVFFWTFIPGIIGLIEGIILLTMTDEAFVQKHGHN